jgi:hypothetical protein
MKYLHPANPPRVNATKAFALQTILSITGLAGQVKIAGIIAAAITGKNPSLCSAGIAQGYVCAAERCLSCSEDDCAILIAGLGLPCGQEFRSGYGCLAMRYIIFDDSSVCPHNYIRRLFLNI